MRCVVVVLFTRLLFFSVPLLFFQTFQMSSSEFHEKFKSKDLRDFRLGTVASSDHETPLTGYEPNRDMNLVNTEELDLAATSDVYWQHSLDDDASLNDPNVDDNQLAKYLAVVVESTGKPVEMRSNNDQFSCDTRNLKSAQNQFPVVPQTEMICQTGGSVQVRIVEEREKAHAQIRTMLDEQRRTIIAECNEKVLHHELLAAHAEQDRKVLQEELLRQQQEFREVHQQDLMKHLELQKFQNSAFDEFTQKKFIEDQKTIMELSGRLQELQNEVNFMNDSKDFMDAESICSGNPHVTSPPGLFPRHPPFVGMLRPLFSSQRQNEEPPNIWDTSGTSKNVFAHPQASSSAPYPQELNSSKWNTWKKTTEEPIHMFRINLLALDPVPKTAEAWFLSEFSCRHRLHRLLIVCNLWHDFVAHLTSFILVLNFSVARDTDCCFSATCHGQCARTGCSL